MKDERTNTDMSKTQEPKASCCARIHYGDWGRSRPCARSGSIERDGKYYCKQHDPVAKEAKRDEQHATWLAARKAKRDEQERIASCVSACAGIPNPAAAMAVARTELNHLILLVGRALEDGICIPGLATMNGAKQALNLLTPAP